MFEVNPGKSKGKSKKGGGKKRKRDAAGGDPSAQYLADPLAAPIVGDFRRFFQRARLPRGRDAARKGLGWGGERPRSAFQGRTNTRTAL